MLSGKICSLFFFDNFVHFKSIEEKKFAYFLQMGKKICILTPFLIHPLSIIFFPYYILFGHIFALPSNRKIYIPAFSLFFYFSSRFDYILENLPKIS